MSTITVMTPKDVFDSITDMPAVMVIGHDLERCMYVHFTQLSDEQLRTQREWAAKADLRFELSDYTPFKEIKQDALSRWPPVRMFEFGCLCCCTDDLVEWNSCGFCQQLEGHLDGCPIQHLGAGEQYNEASLQATNVWQGGWKNGRSGRRCTQRTPTGKLGYSVGRKAWKNRHPR